jgi:predicted AlkP superfamily pyrophosphatase or phosphodiesterase
MNIEELNWIHPFNDSVNLIDVLNALYNKAGRILQNENKELEKFHIQIPNSDKYILLVVDGMGYNLLNRILPESFLIRHVNSVMNTIYPTSTGTVLTSIVTGMTPDKHSINGWFSYDENNNESFMTIPFVNRFEPNIPLKSKFDDIFFERSVYEKLPLKTNIVVKEEFTNSVYSKWISGGKDVLGYKNLSHAFEILKEIVQNDENSFTYCYFGEFDKTCHLHGTNSAEAKLFLEELDKCVEKFYESSKGECTTIITADHGLIDIEEKNSQIILSEDSICSFFYAPPGGEARFTSFYVKDTYLNEFQVEFNIKFGDKAKLLSIDEAEKLNLFGLNGLNTIARKRFGNFVAIWNEGYAFQYSKTPLNHLNESNLTIGVHGGLTKDEMEVPLVILEH